MRTLNDALEQFGYHPATPEVAPRYAEMREKVITLAQDTWGLIPDGPEKTLAFRGLQQFLMHANLAIALTVPADWDTPHVARTLAQLEKPCACGAVNMRDADAVELGGRRHTSSDCS